MTIETFLLVIAVNNNKLLFNESGISDETKLLIRKDELVGMAVVNKGIERLGLYFEEAEKEMNMLVITDKKN